MMVGPSSGACFLGWDQDLNISRALAYKHILQVPVQYSWEIFYTDLISEQIFHSSTWGDNSSPMWPLWCQYFTGALLNFFGCSFLCAKKSTTTLDNNISQKKIFVQTNSHRGNHKLLVDNVRAFHTLNAGHELKKAVWQHSFIERSPTLDHKISGAPQIRWKDLLLCWLLVFQISSLIRRATLYSLLEALFSRIDSWYFRWVQVRRANK